MVGALEGVAEDDDMSDGRISDDGQVEVSSWKFVNLVNDEQRG